MQNKKEIQQIPSNGIYVVSRYTKISRTCLSVYHNSLTALFISMAIQVHFTISYFLFISQWIQLFLSYTFINNHCGCYHYLLWLLLPLLIHTEIITVVDTTIHCGYYHFSFMEIYLFTYIKLSRNVDIFQVPTFPQNERFLYSFTT